MQIMNSFTTSRGVQTCILESDTNRAVVVIGRGGLLMLEASLASSHRVCKTIWQGQGTCWTTCPPALLQLHIQVAQSRCLHHLNCTTGHCRLSQRHSYSSCSFCSCHFIMELPVRDHNAPMLKMLPATPAIQVTNRSRFKTCNPMPLNLSHA